MQLHVDVLKAMQSLEARERLAQMGIEPVDSRGAVGRLLREPLTVWGEIV